MKRNKILILTIIIFLATTGIFVFAKQSKSEANRFVTYKIDIKKQDLKLFWKDDKNEPFRSIQNLKLWLNKNNKNLVFAMNAGMYKSGNYPQGLFIEKQKVLSPLDTSAGTGNFYLKPNGVFYITTDNIPVICNTTNFINTGKIKYATQSGPMLVIDGQIHSAFKQGSTN